MNEEQRQAVEQIVGTTGDAALCGWAGTGKTFTTARAIERWRQSGSSVAVLAPTHRACGVLREELAAAGVHVDVTTVHRGCGLVPCDRTGKAMEVADPVARRADVVVVDEASMIGTDVLAKLRKLPGRRVYVGDPYQLPPVGEKSSPAFQGVPTAWLRKTVRYAPGSDLDELTDALRQCVDLDRLPSLEAIEARMQFVRGGLPAAARLWHGHPDSVIVGYRNATVVEALRRVQGSQRLELRVGDPVTFLEAWSPWDAEKRRPVRRCHSGTEGVIERIAEGVATVRYEGGGSDDVPMVVPDMCDAVKALRKTLGAYARSSKEQWQRYCDREPMLKPWRDKSALDAQREISQYGLLRQTWAMTVHKSQGGSWGRVVVMWDDLLAAKNRPSLFCKLLYVAITRTRNAGELYFVKG